MKNITVEEFQKDVKEVVRKIIDDNRKPNLKIYGVPRGGVNTAFLIKSYLPFSEVVSNPNIADIIVDDIVDSGETKIRYSEYNKPFYAIYENPTEWLVLPWERMDQGTPIEDNFIRVKQFLVGDITEEQKENVKEELENILNNFFNETEE